LKPGKTAKPRRPEKTWELADAGFRQFGVEPYLSYRIKKITLFASLLFNNLGAEGSGEEIRLNQIQGKRDVTGAIPSIGVKLRF
jgi:hypothetical protein